MSLQSRWFERKLSPELWPLFPLHSLFVFLSALRRILYRFGVFSSTRLPVPVIVVGNLIVGGAGKTPLVLWLAEELQRRGRQPGIISRGYGSAATTPRPVVPNSVAAEVGDEPRLLAQRSGRPVWVGRDRAATAAAMLAAHPQVDVIISDDGLQHYRLQRDVELAVFDARGAGNGWRLPLGPLREPLSRLGAVSAIICNGKSPGLELPSRVPSFAMTLQPGDFYRLGEPETKANAGALKGRALHAVAGIGDPKRFFCTLENMGLEIIQHPFPDHYAYTASDLDFGANSVLLMTEKDAVKCAGLTQHETWVLPVTADLPSDLLDTLLEKLDGR